MLSAKCGSCGGKHETIDEYRECAGARKEAESAASIMDNMTGAPATVNPPSDAQVKFAMDLLASKVWPDEITEADLRGMERRQVSSLINGLKAQPYKNGSGVKPQSLETYTAYRDVPDGRYALKFIDGWKFFQVKQGRKFTFLDMLIGSPGDYRKQKVMGAAANKALEEIQKDPRAASISYGLHAKVCGVCSSPLTNDESLKYGIGPICRGKMGW